MRPYRSLLFVPGHRESWVEKAVRSGCDAIVLDLEDSVPEEEKAAARQQVRDSIARVCESGASVGLLVRVNSLGTGMTADDLEAAVVPGLDGVFAPKVSDGTDVVRFDTLIDLFERRSGASRVELVVPVETIPAIQNCRAIAVSTRVAAMVGPTAEHADIAREVGFEWTPGGQETLYLRSRVLLACREAGIHPMTALWERVDDLDGLREFALGGRRLGFRGMVAIHPSHVPFINEVFTPSAEQIEFYTGLRDAFARAAEHGIGAVRYRGLHIDRAHYDKAVRWLAEAAELTTGAES